MTVKTDKKSRKALLTAALSGAAADFVNGFLGAGGGIILLWMFSRLNPDRSDRGARDNFACVVAAVLPLCVVSAVTYSGGGHFNRDIFPVLVLPAMAGGISGAFLTDRLDTAALKTVFAVLVVIAGINMILR